MKRVLAMVSSFGFVAGGALFGAAAPAQADLPLPEGIYTFMQDGKAIGVWTIYPVCAQTVGDLRNNMELPVGCLVHIGADQYGGVYGGDARQTGGEGHWAFTQTDLQGFICPDGSKSKVQETYEFDSTSWTGTRTRVNAEQCGVQAAMTKVPFQLVFQKPLPIPVQQFPLYCPPDDGLKRCR
ncbi:MULTISPECIES: hypothetical protein [unclassified Mycolicibacterium]|uniref:hypothetical protein n=1 Tax=unclassified Mycolicibacterium TaxID=2636767 RepID=UPI001EE3B9DB|nr:MULTISPECIES: hypothetical protein [unclassified Mycolicibacterium]